MGSHAADVPPLVASPAGFLVHDMARLALDRPDQAEALRVWAQRNGIDPQLVVASEPVRIYADRIEFTSYVPARGKPRRLLMWGEEFATVERVHFCRPTPLPAVVLPQGRK